MQKNEYAKKSPEPEIIRLRAFCGFIWILLLFFATGAYAVYVIVSQGLDHFRFRVKKALLADVVIFTVYCAGYLSYAVNFDIGVLAVGVDLCAAGGAGVLFCFIF